VAALPPDHPVNAALRTSLEKLRDEAADPQLADRIDAVLTGQETLRGLYTSQVFQSAFAKPLQRLTTAIADLNPEDVARLSPPPAPYYEGTTGIPPSTKPEA
jgi:hypothetical protein